MWRGVNRMVNLNKDLAIVDSDLCYPWFRVYIITFKISETTARTLFPNGNLTLEFLPMEVDGGGEYQAPWINKNKYYLLQPYYMPVLNLYYRPQYYVLFVCTFYSFNSCMNCLLFVHLFYSEYLGNLPKFKGFVRRLGRLHALTWPRWESSQPGQEAPFGGHRGESIKCSLVQAVPPTMSLSSKWVRKVWHPPLLPNCFSFFTSH